MRLVMLVVLTVSLPAFAQSVEPALVGTWSAPLLGFEMVLRVDADGTCVFDEERGRCTAKGGTLVWTGEEGSERYQYTLRGDTLTVSGGDMETAIAFQRKGGRRQPVAEDTAPPAPAPPAGAGQPFSKDAWGVKLVAPPGWRLVERDGAVLGGSDTEAGLLILRYVPHTTREELVAEYQRGVNEQGISATPTVEATPWKAGKATGIAGELAGSTGDGAKVRIRSVAVLAPHGGALVVAGLTTPDRYANLKTRVEQLAATVVLQKPKQVPGGELAGAYAFIYVSKSGSYSREAYLTLCKSGRFTRRGEMVGSAELSGGARGNAYSGSNNAGSWRAEGGTLILEFGDGTSAQVPFRVSQDPKDRGGYGPGVYFGSDLYQKTGAGDC
jgi:hypothetical protein